MHDSSRDFLLKLATFRPTRPLSRRSGRLASITPYSSHAYEQGANSFLSTAIISELLSIEQLIFIATAFVSANHKRSTTVALLNRIGDLIAARLRERAQLVSSSSQALSLDDWRSLHLVSSSAIATSFARVGLKHFALFTAISFWAQGSMKYSLIRPKSKSNMTWLAALLWSFSQVGFYDKQLWREASLLLQGNPVRWLKLMDADDCLKLIWAMARVKHDSDPALVQLLVDRAATQVGKLSMEELGSIWTVLANISKKDKHPPSERLLFALSKASRVKINSIKPTTLSLVFTSIATLMSICPPVDEGFWKRTDGTPHSVSELLNDVAIWSANKASNFKSDELVALLVSMSSMGYRNPWALKGICRKLVMPRKLAGSSLLQPPLIKSLSTDQLLLLLQCFSSLDHYSSSLLSRILTLMQESELTPSCLIKALRHLVRLRHCDEGFLTYAVNKLLSSNMDKGQRNEAALLFAMIDTKGLCTRLILDSCSSWSDSSPVDSHTNTHLARCLFSSTTKMQAEDRDMTSAAQIFDQQYMDERIAFVSSSNEGRGIRCLNLLIQDVEKQLRQRVQKATFSTCDAPSISCHSFFNLDLQSGLFADIAVPSSNSYKGRGLVVILLTELDYLRFWPGGEMDRSSRPLMPLTLLRMNLIKSLGWKVKTVVWQEWIDFKQRKSRRQE